VLADSFGRIATDLRVSVTDRCNLRCSYCMPAGGLDWLPGPALPTDGEMTRLIAIAVRQLGITEVRFTGGEPVGRGSAPAETFLVDNGPHEDGVIGSVTRPFRAACDRIRLAADGQIRNCQLI
jgi:GTP 3',8-cyclase